MSSNIDRRKAAMASRNNQGLNSRRSKLTGLILGGGVLFVFIGPILVIPLTLSVDLPGDVQAAIVVTTLLLSFAGLIFGGAMVISKMMTSSSSKEPDTSYYSAYFNSLSPEWQKKWHDEVKRRRATETDTEQPGFGNWYWGAIRAQRNLSNSEAPVGIRSVHADAIWDHYAPALLGRETSLMIYSDKNGFTLTPYAEPGVQDYPSPLPTVMVDDGRNTQTYMWRNLIEMDDDEYPVVFGDVVIVGQLGVPVIYGMSYVETWFPADYWLTVYPKKETRVNSWGFMGVDLEEASREFKSHYTVQTNKKKWANLLLNPAVAMELITIGDPVRFTVDGGRMALHTDSTWLHPESIDRWVSVLRTIAKSAQAAESSF